MTTKHFLTGATLLSGLLLLNAPLFAAVESDVVGYTTITTSPGFNMMGTVFQGLGQETISLNELLDGAFEEGDEIQVFHNDTGTYAVFKFSGGEWKTGPFSADRNPLSVGDSFWINTPDHSVTVTLKGAVKRGDFLFQTNGGFQMVCVDFPTEIKLNDGNVEWSGFQNGDEIQIVDETGTYRRYTFSTSSGKWMTGPFEANVTLAAGKSFWLRSASAAATIRVKSPLE